MTRARLLLLVITAGTVLATAAPAAAHVTVSPPTAAAGSFARFALRVPTEREDASTVKVEVQLPKALSFTTFEATPGWTRSVTTETIPENERPAPDSPDEAAPTSRVATVTWAGGTIGPGEFFEFGLSAKVPDAPGDLEFKAIQTYGNGEVVRWIADDPKADNPAPHVAVEAAGAGPSAPGPAAAPVAAAPAPSETKGTVALILAIVAAALGAAALAVGLRARAAR
jgi:uncharacterized protein YcnI